MEGGRAVGEQAAVGGGQPVPAVGAGFAEDWGAASGRRDGVARHCRAGGARAFPNTVEHIGDGVVLNDDARHR